MYDYNSIHALLVLVEIFVCLTASQATAPPSQRTSPPPHLLSAKITALTSSTKPHLLTLSLSFITPHEYSSPCMKRDSNHLHYFPLHRHLHHHLTLPNSASPRRRRTPPLGTNSLHIGGAGAHSRGLPFRSPVSSQILIGQSLPIT